MNIKTMICGLLAFVAAAACTPKDEPQVTPKLDVSGTSLTLAAADAEGTFTVTSNQNWTASADAAWVHVTPASGEASDTPVTVKVSADDNAEVAARTATVTVTAGSLVKTVSVAQAGASAQVPEEEEPENPGEEPGEEPEQEPTPVPEIPAGFVASTLWEGSKDLTWESGMQELAYGAYNWYRRNPGEYLKVQINPTNPDEVWMMGVMYADESGSWVKIPSLPDSYYKPVDGVVVIELTADVLALLSSPNNGIIFHGQNVTITKVELYSDPNAEEEPASANLLSNGDFEQGAAGWMGWWSGYTQEVTEGRNGGKALLLTLAACDELWSAQLVQDIAALEAGVTYAYEFYVKADTEGHPVQVCAQNPTPPDYPGLYVFETHTAGTDWTQCAGEFTYDGNPESITRVGVQFGIKGEGGQKLWIDDFSFGPKQ